jgi:hypothetical protein
MAFSLTTYLLAALFGLIVLLALSSLFERNGDGD